MPDDCNQHLSSELGCPPSYECQEQAAGTTAAQFLPWESMYKLSIHVCTGRWAMAACITADVFFMKLSVVRAVQLYIAAAGQEWVFVLMPS